MLSPRADAKLLVIATTTDLSDLVHRIGGDQTVTFAVAKGTQDPHHIEAKPSFMVRFHKADLVVSQGLELEWAWLEGLTKGARNPRILRGTTGFLELGPELNPLEISKGKVSRAEGDVHPNGNPHFHLDPIRMGQAGQILAKRLGELDPEHQDLFDSRANSYKKELEDKTQDWKKRIKKTGIQEIVTHHKTLTYFCNRFEIKCQLQLEPKPGIPPTASHLLEVIAQMKGRQIKLVLIENYFSSDFAEKLKAQVPQAQVKRVPVSVGGESKISNQIDLYEKLVQVFEEASL